MEPTLLNKLILIFVIFLIGVSIIDGFTILTPKIIEGNTNEATGCQDIVTQNAGDIAYLQEEFKIVTKFGEKIKDINKLHVTVKELNDKQKKSINKLEESSPY